ncbi:MAG: hypothetical protein IT430_20015 [Phycisphaerales bacterium]|nr:hypothetical protein [Phycisphaerales bacterium]
MLRMVVLVKKSTLHILAEHSEQDMGPIVELNDTEALVMLTAEVVARLIALAKPEDERLDDVIHRLAL